MKKLQLLPPVLIGFTFLTCLYIVSRQNYLFFHSLSELFSIVVACGIFMVAWNSRKFFENNYFLFLGIAYLFIAATDFMHSITYAGMGVFPKGSTNLPTQLWIAARYMESISLMIAPVFLKRTFKAHLAFIGYGFIFAFIMASLFQWNIFPDCFREGEGLTAFKKTSEYIISIFLVIAIIFLQINRDKFERKVIGLLTVSISLTIVSELFFTFYVHAYGMSNLAGHFCKIISYYLIYKAIIETGLMEPYLLLFRNLKKSEEELQKARDELEIKIKSRTDELVIKNQELKEEIQERWKAEEAFKESEEKYSSLVEESLTGVYINQNDKIEFANDRFAEIYEYPKEEIIGMNPLDLVHSDDLELVKKASTNRLEGKDAPVEYEARGITKNGRVIWVVRRNKLITYNGKPAILGNVADSTQRKMMERKLRTLSAQLLDAEETERKRIARELHDGIGQSLSAVKFNIETVLNYLDLQEYGRTKESLKSIIPLIQSTVEETRRITMDLRPSILDDLGLLPTINWLCREFRKLCPNTNIEKAILIEEASIPDTLKTVIYRILQEALNNILKHSKAGNIILSLSEKQNEIVIILRDDGIGFDTGDMEAGGEAERGLGLSNMRERVNLSGGVFIIESAKGKGTKIIASWTIDTSQSQNY